MDGREEWELMWKVPSRMLQERVEEASGLEGTSFEEAIRRRREFRYFY